MSFGAGGGIPPAVIVLIALTAGLSIAGKLMPDTVLERGVLIGNFVWAGQFWRLATWSFFETDPISLLFACLMFYWFGRDLVSVWGSQKFVTIYLGFAILVGVLTAVVGRFVWHTVGMVPYFGT